MGDAFDTPQQPDDGQEFDRYGRYLIPHPVTGKRTAWTRATTYAKSISDTYALGQWMLRMAVKGVATRPDLYALAASTPIDDKDALNRIAEDAKEAAAAKAGANLGTALHAFTEQIDRGGTPIVPEPWARDIAAYKAMLSAHGIRIDPGLIERKVVVPDIGVAGTLDRVVDRGGLKIGDLKTGKDLSFGWLEIAIQLAIYSRATHIWDPTTRAFSPMPAVDQDIALVFHLPVGKATATLYEVDIAAGWEATRLCGQVRDWRKRKDLARVVALGTPSAASTPTAKAPDKKAAAKKATAAKANGHKGDTGSGSLGLHALINKAATVAELEALWAEADRDGAWRDAHTETARKRKSFLLSTGQGTK